MIIWHDRSIWLLEYIEYMEYMEFMIKILKFQVISENKIIRNIFYSRGARENIQTFSLNGSDNNRNISNLSFLLNWFIFAVLQKKFLL